MRFCFYHGSAATSGPRPLHYRGFTVTLRHTTRSHSDTRHDHTQTHHTITLRHTTRSHSDTPHDHTQRHHTITLRHTTRSHSDTPHSGRTPLDGWSPRRRELYLTRHNTHKGQTSMPPSGIRTHNPSKRAAAEPRLTPRGHWDRQERFNMKRILSLW
jgi:hypothetical protein